MMTRSIRPLAAAFAGAALSVLPAAAQDAPASAAKEARILFAPMVRDYRAEDRHAIYLGMELCRVSGFHPGLGFTPDEGSWRMKSGAKPSASLREKPFPRLRVNQSLPSARPAS